MPIRVLELRSVWGTGGGPEKTILVGAAKADRRRFEVTVCYLRHAADSVFGIETTARSLGVDYVELVECRSYDPAIWPALRRLVQDRRIDIVHAHDYKTDLLAYALAARAGVMPLSTAHGWVGSSWRERFLYYPADRWLLARFPMVIAVSPEIAGVLRASGTSQDRIVMLLNGVDPAVFRRVPTARTEARAAIGLAPDAWAIGAIGRLEIQKRIDLLIDAVACLRRNHPQVTLVIAGDGSLRSALEAQAARVAPGAVRFLGHRSDVIALHHALDCFVQSSTYEGTSNSLLEALAMETPVVATAVGGTSALVEHDRHALLVRAGDVDGLASAIRQTLENTAATAARVHNARAHVEHHLSFEQRTRRLEHIYEALFASGSRDVADEEVAV